MSNVKPGSPPVMPKKPAKNRFFFLDTIDFLVEDELFRVPRLAFEGREGSPFADAAKIQTEGSNSDAGSPVHLPVSKIDFEALCHVLYRTIIPGHRQDVTKEEWKRVMKLASMWNMKDIRELARGKLSVLLVEPTELIQAAREFNVTDWFRRGSYELATQRTPFHPVVVGLSIGIDTAARLLYIQGKRAMDAWKVDPNAMISILTTEDTGITVACDGCGSSGGLFSDPGQVNHGLWGSTSSAFGGPAQANHGLGTWGAPPVNRFRLRCPEENKSQGSSTKNRKKGTTAIPNSAPVTSAVVRKDSVVYEMINEEFADELKLIEEAEAAHEGSQ